MTKYYKQLGGHYTPSEIVVTTKRKRIQIFCPYCNSPLNERWDEFWDGETETVWQYYECPQCGREYHDRDDLYQQILKGR